MNASKRLFFGILSSLLLAAGFAHAADRLDPITQSVHRSITPLQDDDGTAGDPPPPINLPCMSGGDGEN